MRLQAQAYLGIAQVISNHAYSYGEDRTRGHVVTNHGKQNVMDFHVERQRLERSKERGSKGSSGQLSLFAYINKRS